jgi:hypothetical protein
VLLQSARFLKNHKPKRRSPTTIVFNGAKITLNKTGASIVIRDKYGVFVGMRELHTVMQALDESLANGELNLELCEVEKTLQETQNSSLFSQ